MSANCVLTFYSLPSTANEASFEEVWQKYVLGKVDGVACKQVFRFEKTPEALVAYLEKRERVNKPLLKDIAEMLDSGAAYMFVASTQGGPIYGEYITDYLA